MTAQRRALAARRVWKHCLAAVALVGGVAAPVHALTPQELGLIINVDDPVSVMVGDYYQLRRHIPAENVVRVRTAATPEMTPLQFATLNREVNARLPRRVQAIALAWTQPFRVGCMSVTSAFAFGYDTRFCASGCTSTPYSPYFNSDSRQPYTDHHIRPTMSLAGSWPDVRALIDRGVAADHSAPRGTAYLMATSDANRNVREPSFHSAKLLAGAGVDVRVMRSNTLRGRRDVLFYFTGLRWVLDIASNRFLPGAIADHLTSSGGVLVGGRQMSALAWLHAGATGSYGTVVEPCAFTAKFPNPAIVMRRYLAGETLLESYWKSVAMPAQGIFIGEPLATPFRPQR